jgi:hypothetical protein
VHERLAAAAPPPDLSPDLQRPPVPSAESDAPEVTYVLRRRRGVGLALALAAAIAVFAGGFAFGHSKGKPAAFAAERTVPMHGAGGSHGLIRIASPDSVGNWPMQVEVSGLPKQPNGRSYYELWLSHDGKPAAPCGSFRVHGNTTTVRLTVPYELKDYDGWVVTAQRNEAATPGRIVLTT